MKKIIALAMTLVIFSTSVLAATASSIQTELNNANAQLKDAKADLQENKNEQKDVLKEMEVLDKNITSTENEISNTKASISELEKEIKISEENITYMEKEYEKKSELRKERMVAYYKSGTNSLWEILDETDDPTERMYVERIIERVLAYDEDLMNEIEEEKKAIEDEKAQLEENKVALNTLKENLEIKLANLNETVEVRTKYMSQLQADEKLLEKSIDEITKKANELETELKRIASSSSNSTYMGGTMTWPLPGYYTITSPFGNRLHPILKVYKLHTGVDIAGSGCNGKNVVAAADGKVITSAFLSGYGNTVIIDHGGGVVTLYAHSSKLLVKAGDTVKAGQTIMLVGTTGNSTGPHLHFEVRIDGKYVNPLDGYIKAK